MCGVARSPMRARRRCDAVVGDPFGASPCRLMSRTCRRARSMDHGCAALTAAMPLDVSRTSTDREPVDGGRGMGADARARRLARRGAAGGRAAIRTVRQPGRVRGVVPDVRATAASPSPTWPVRVRRARPRPGQARVAESVLAPLQPRPAQPARPEQRGAGAVRPRHATSSACASCRRSCATRRSGASC